RRFHRHDSNTRVLPLQYLADAGDGSAGAHAGDEHVHLAVRVFPDFAGGRLAMGLRVGGVAELVQRDCPGDLVPQRFRPLDRLRPPRSASSTIASAMRSLTLPPGLRSSSLASRRAPSPMRGSCTRGVRPIVACTPRYSVPGTSYA